MSELMMCENRNPATFEELRDRKEQRATRELPKATTELCRIWHREGQRAMPTVQITEGCGNQWH